jgi:hypothetical protein
MRTGFPNQPGPQQLSLRRGVVVACRPAGAAQELEVTIGSGPDATEGLAVNYPALTGQAVPGDVVLLNTTGVDLGLGTGGRHFVLSVDRVSAPEAANASDAPASASIGPGHIMKLRYTPLQLRCLAVEEDDSPWHETMATARDHGGMPVVSACLHSMVPVIAAAIRLARPEAQIVYVMTDGAALPAAFSRLLWRMRDVGLIDASITCGHSFGGDLEAVNHWSALLAARHCLKATHAIVGMGPGIVGTGTPFGFTGMEQAAVLNSVACLGGSPVAALRMSFADKRERHQGVSHHSLTVLGVGTLVRATVAVPPLQPQQRALVSAQLQGGGIITRHDVQWETDPGGAIELCVELGVGLSTMGRSHTEEPEFFAAAASAGVVAARLP